MTSPDPKALLKGLELFQRAQQLHAARAHAPAAEAYAQALRLMPDHPKVLVEYGRLAEDVGDWKSAEKIYRRLMAVSQLTNLDGKLGLALYHLARYEDAIPLLAAYATRNPRDGAVLRFLSTCCFRLMRWQDAMDYARQAWAVDPHPDAMSLMMAVLVELGTGEPLAPLVEEALARFPGEWQVRKLAAEHLLKAGDYRRGFPLFADMRIPPSGERHPADAIAVPWWSGERFDGTLLVGAEQGIGDEILTASMYPDLVAMGQEAVVEADARLLPVLRRSFPALTFIARNEGGLAAIAAARPGCRKVISGDLGRFFRADVEDFGTQAPWLVADPARVRHFREKYRLLWPGRPCIGISWKSQRVMKSGTRKDIPLAYFAPLFAATDAAFVNLQYGETAGDIATLGEHAARLFVDPEVDTLDDFDALFAQVAALDLVVTSSNVTAHVAGALGKPCWVILPRERPVIWYWGYSGERTPWYPATRIFRNPVDTDWTGLFARIAAALAAEAPARP